MFVDLFNSLVEYFSSTGFSQIFEEFKLIFGNLDFSLIKDTFAAIGEFVGSLLG